MNSVAVSTARLRPPWVIPAGDWLLYTFAAVNPFFVFAIVLSRDSAPFWAVVVAALLILFRFAHSGGYFWIDKTHLFLLLLLLAYLWATCLVFAQESPQSWLGRTPMDRAVTIDLRVLYVAVAFFAFTNLLADASEEVFARILRIQIYVGIAIALFGLAQYVLAVVFGSNMLVGIEPTNESFVLRGNLFKLGRERIFRASAFFNEPSYFGFFLVPLTVKMIVARSFGQTITSKAGDLWLIGILVCAILANFTFTALLSICIILSAFAITLSGELRKKARYLLVAAIIVAAVMAVSPIGGAVLERAGQVFQIRDRSTIDRLVRAYTSSRVFLDNMWLGVGPGGYAFWYPRMGGLDRAVMATPLNMWLSFLTDVGLLGTIPLVLFLLSVLHRSYKRMREHALIRIYLWSVCSTLVLLTIVDIWYGELFWFECAMLVTLSCGVGLRGRRNGQSEHIHTEQL